MGAQWAMIVLIHFNIKRSSPAERPIFFFAPETKWAMIAHLFSGTKNKIYFKQRTYITICNTQFKFFVKKQYLLYLRLNLFMIMFFAAEIKLPGK